jgi:hypothetical protein
LCAHPACNQQLDFEIPIILRGEGRIFAFLCLRKRLSRALGEEHRRSKPLRPVRVLSLASEGRSGFWMVGSGHGVRTAERWVLWRPRRFHCPHPAWRGSAKTSGRAGVVSRRAYPARAAAGSQPTARMLIASASWGAYMRSNPTRGWDRRKASRAGLAWALMVADDPAGCDCTAHSRRHCIRSEGRRGVFRYFDPGTAVGGSEKRSHTRPGWRSLGRKRCHRAAGNGGKGGKGEPGSRNASTAQRSVSRGSPAVRRDGVKRGPRQARRRGTMSAAGRGEPPAATSGQPPIARPNGTNP